MFPLPAVPVCSAPCTLIPLEETTGFIPLLYVSSTHTHTCFPYIQTSRCFTLLPKTLWGLMCRSSTKAAPIRSPCLLCMLLKHKASGPVHYSDPLAVYQSINQSVCLSDPSLCLSHICSPPPPYECVCVTDTSPVFRPSVSTHKHTQTHTNTRLRPHSHRLLFVTIMLMSLLCSFFLKPTGVPHSHPLNTEV